MQNRTRMKLYMITVLTLFVATISKVTGQDPYCETDGCPCCLSKMCNIKGKCTDGCVDGYYGGKCYNQCPPYCTRCAREFGARSNSDYQKCYLCADGYYNGTGVKDCSTPCPVNCLNNNCDKSSGRCLDGCTSVNFGGVKCDTCAIGYYGANCDPCSEYCKDDACDVGNGRCTNGCTDSWFTGTKCDQCQTGKHGDHCDETCPDNCRNNVCDRYDGTCTSCKGNFAGSKCEECNPQYYGDNCDKVCRNCLDGQCDRNTGICGNCVGGIYSQYCNITCSIWCKNNVCYRGNATCVEGCWGRYSGDKCCVNNNNCELCDTVSTCSTCKSGFYGQSCGQTCPDKCAGSCDKSSGDCTACKAGFHSNKCNEACPHQCLDDKCIQQSGECIACSTGYHGNVCNNTCPANCVDNMCEQDGGKCIGCIDGYHGASCDVDCATHCINETCVQESGACLYGCDNGHSDWSTCKQAPPPPPPPSPVGGALGGGVGGLVVVALVIVGAVFLYRRRQQNRDPYIQGDASKQDEDKYIYENGSIQVEVAKPEQKPSKQKKKYANKPEFHDIPDVVSGEPEVEENAYYQFSNRISKVDLYYYVTSTSKDFFNEEFQKLPQSLIHPCTVARKSENIAKNRFNSIYPYDHSRVTIAEDKNFFINACYIKGNRKEKAYIASLGPTEATTDKYASFWRMVWHEKSDVIVMLTNLQEATGMKCEQYWPELGESLTFPRQEVTCDSVEEYSEYTVRTFTLKKNKERRTINQLHFTAWPDKGVPDNVTCMIEFRQRVKSTSTLSQGPIVVHCSAGIGRTGTYIAIDLLTEEGEAEGSVDVFACVRNLRDQRVNMVQTTDQYIYVHRAIVHTLTFDVDNNPVETFNEHVSTMSQALYSSMFQKLKTVIEGVNAEDREAVATNTKFTDNNRSGSNIPGDLHRPRLYLNRSFNESSYINAMYVNGFKTRNQFILAQTPLPSTVPDFICLAYQEQCRCIVSMGDIDEHTEDVGHYIPPDNQTLTYGSFIVSSTKSQPKYNHQLRKIKIENTGKQSTGERTIYHYQYTDWKKGEKTPANVSHFAQFVQEVTSQSSKPDTDVSPILLHCLTGGERCGLFCVVSLLFEKADILRQVSVANTVRQVRLRRSNVVCNKEQLKFIHECVSVQMEKFSTYGNAGM